MSEVAEKVELTEEQLIDRYIKMRDLVAQKKKEFEAMIAPYKNGMEKIEAILLKRLNAAGLTSFSCRGVGTAYSKIATSVTAADKVEFMDFVKTRDMWQLLEVRPAKKNVEEYLEEHQELPPGLNMSRVTVVNVERS